jgi:hypothetical protein
VQSVGGDEENAPSCCCPYYGAAITANCRSRLIEAALIDPYAVICFMTDGIVTSRELKGLPRAKEVFEGEPPAGTVMELGDWEFEKMQGGFFLQSGVYCLVHKSGKTKDKTRGVDPRNFILKMPLKDLMMDRVLREWRRIDDRYTLDIEIRNYITAGAAAASDERFKLIGRWCDTKRTIDVHNLGVKRTMIAEYPEFYRSAPGFKGVISRKTVERTAEVLGASFNDVAACYRSGEALRCRFLVPSVPRGSETPDELGMMAKPEWLNPDYDDGEDEGMFTLTKEDEETAEILIGGR